MRHGHLRHAGRGRHADTDADAVHADTDTDWCHADADADTADADTDHSRRRDGDADRHTVCCNAADVDTNSPQRHQDAPAFGHRDPDGHCATGPERPPGSIDQ